MNKFDKLPALYYLGFYHPKFDYYEDCFYDNCNFNEFSHRILRLKDRDYTATHYFRDILTKLIEDEEISIAAVPSHVALESNSGIRDLASYLVKSKKNYIDAVKCLERVITVDKYSQTSRKMAIPINSIRVESDFNKSFITVTSNVVMLSCINPRTEDIMVCIEFVGEDVPSHVTFQVIRDDVYVRLLKDVNKKMEDRNLFMGTFKETGKHRFKIIPNVDVWLDTNKAAIFLAALDELSLQLKDLNLTQRQLQIH
jgi:hypothetical protein